VGVAALLLALQLVGQTGASFDAKAQRLSARGAAAADVRAPSAEIARVKAERAARKQAEHKLEAALKALGGDPAGEPARKALDGAQVSDEEYGSDGSIELTLTIATDGLGLGRKR
jgi:hypothetical protein